MPDDEHHIRAILTSEQRAQDMRLWIDPGFVNHRLVDSVLGAEWAAAINARLERIPESMPEGLRQGQVANVYTRALVEYCARTPVPGLAELMAHGKGGLFASVVDVAGTPDVSTRDSTRVVSQIVVPGLTTPRVELHYSTEHIFSDTTRMQLSQDDVHAVVALLQKADEEAWIFRPLVIGGPLLRPPEGEPDPLPGAEWFGWDFFEVFAEDVDEFARVRDVALPTDIAIMERISEKAFKTCLGEILGDKVVKDWGGETSDHYTAHLHVGGRQKTGAFLLKGPAKFAPMSLNTLGKNNDQIVRLAQEPAQVLFVQHCHEILPAVRATLRAFAVQIGHSRHYALLDGRESLRILQAYDKVERALELSAG